MKKIIFVLLLALLLIVPVNATWADLSYHSKVYYTVTNASTDGYAFQTVVSWLSGMNSHFDDLQFYNSNETQTIPFYIPPEGGGTTTEVIAGDYANLWVKPPAGETGFWIYFNNANVTNSLENVYATFPLLGDDFTKDSVMNGSLWQNFYSGTYTIGGGSYLNTESGYLLSVNNFTNCTVITRASLLGISGVRVFSTAVRASDFNNLVYANRYSDVNYYHRIYLGQGGSFTELVNEGTSSAIPQGSYEVYHTIVNGSRVYDEFYGHAVVTTNTSIQSVGHIGFSTNTNMAIYYILVNGYNATAPATTAAQSGSSETYAIATVNITPTVGTTNSTSISFNDTTSNASAYAWNWSFGDGTYSNLQNTTHIYTYAGVFPVSLQVSIYGGTTAYSVPTYITITDVPPTPTSNLPGAYVPHNVRFFFVSTQTGAKLSGLTITATPTGQTSSPSSWIEQVLGLNSNLNMPTTVLSGTTGQDGSINFLMAEVIQYNIVISGTNITNQSLLVYPKDYDYQIGVKTASYQDFYTAPTYNLTYTNTTDNSNVTLGFNINDPSNQTTNITFSVTNGGTPVYSVPVTIIGGVGTASYTVLNSRGAIYTWGFTANSTFGTGNIISMYKDITLRGNGSLIPTYGLTETQRMWVAVMFIFAFAGIFGAKSVKFGVVLVPLVMGGFFWYVGWLPWQIGGVISVLSCLGVLMYMRAQERVTMGS